MQRAHRPLALIPWPPGIGPAPSWQPRFDGDVEPGINEQTNPSPRPSPRSSLAGKGSSRIAPSPRESSEDQMQEFSRVLSVHFYQL